MYAIVYRDNAYLISQSNYLYLQHLLKAVMGNEVQFCNACNKIDSQETSFKLKESACVQFIDNLPKVKGKFNFQKQASFNKLQRAASQYCQNNFIEKTHVPIIARLLAYQQNHYFQVIKQLPLPLRERFVMNQQNIDLELMDSLYYYFIVKNKRKATPQLFLDSSPIKLPPVIDIEQISEENRQDLTCEGLYLLRNGKVALVIMAAGSSELSSVTSKALATLPLMGDPTALQILLQRYTTYLRPTVDLVSSDVTVKRQKQAITPIIIICCQNNYEAIKKILQKNGFFGLPEVYFKLVLEDRTVPLIDSHGKLCISFEEKTLSYPAGTAMTVAKILGHKLKSFLECCSIEYVHFIGCENIAQMPGDPLLLGLTSKFKRKIAGKCVSPTSLYQSYPRYVSTKSAFHLLDLKQLNVLGDITLMINAPLALNSMLFNFSSLVEFYHSYQTNLYIAKRFHMFQVRQNYYDFDLKRPVVNEKVYSFQQDIRDYISASTDTIVVKYRQEHFKPIISLRSSDLEEMCQTYQEPQLY